MKTVALFIALCTIPVHAAPKIGIASWYGKHANGRYTASGERFDMNALTCASRTLPMGTMLRVTNLHNGKSVIVKVNDRGPMAPERILDLSYEAAKEIGIDRSGLGKVSVERLSQDMIVKSQDTGNSLQ